ncbi:hypothetical protein DCS32_06025 [Dokdonia sp. Dokd-P16]|uniref:class I SAM-dependent methyltransferase n=1 Tax=Dokdonia sp. Dokd-P16 TaxID=2173169 RepID=UPI000D5457AA|nr:class I SAM-dependent methyltransferase [Dokdonia sp. Dokd-P16]AWH73730.1 hypothetical protein DCS32_06025 [Dokdonia sp. Dokd-P16]
MNLKIWTPRYAKNRISLYIYEQFNKDKPWIAPTAIQWLDEHLNKNMMGVEFGSGRSTVWYAKRLKSLISIEDHQDWFKQVNDDLKNSDIDNISYLFKPSIMDSEGNIPYIELMDSIEESSVDIIVVDGKHRDTLALKAIDKLASGGYLLLDDAERYIPLKTHAPYNYLNQQSEQLPTWKEFSNVTKQWKQLQFSSGVSDTVILIKP